MIVFLKDSARLLIQAIGRNRKFFDATRAYTIDIKIYKMEDNKDLSKMIQDYRYDTEAD